MRLCSTRGTMSFSDLMQACSWNPYRPFKLKVSLIVREVVDALSEQAEHQSGAAHQKVSN